MNGDAREDSLGRFVPKHQGKAQQSITRFFQPRETHVDPETATVVTVPPRITTVQKKPNSLGYYATMHKFHKFHPQKHAVGDEEHIAHIGTIPDIPVARMCTNLVRHRDLGKILDALASVPDNQWEKTPSSRRLHVAIEHDDENTDKIPLSARIAINFALNGEDVQWRAPSACTDVDIEWYCSAQQNNQVLQPMRRNTNHPYAELYLGCNANITVRTQKGALLREQHIESGRVIIYHAPEYLPWRWGSVTRWFKFDTKKDPQPCFVVLRFFSFSSERSEKRQHVSASSSSS